MRPSSPVNQPCNPAAFEPAGALADGSVYENVQCDNGSRGSLGVVCGKRYLLGLLVSLIESLVCVNETRHCVASTSGCATMRTQATRVSCGRCGLLEWLWNGSGMALEWLRRLPIGIATVSALTSANKKPNCFKASTPAPGCPRLRFVSTMTPSVPFVDHLKIHIYCPGFNVAKD